MFLSTLAKLWRRDVGVPWSRGEAVAATWIVRGQVAAPPRVPRGYSEKAKTGFGSGPTECLVTAQVTKGMEVVRAIEKVGSQQGKTAKTVLINDCGQIA